MNNDEKESTKVVHLKDEEEDTYSDDDLFNINSWGADLSFRELVNMYEDDELLKPELQRNYVWDKNEASRFIDSVLLGLPVPSIFLANTTDEKKLIIDGFQRIMTVYDFINGIFQKDKKVFKLANSKRINERWKGKSFKELTDTEQRRIRNTTIHAIIFEQKKPIEGDTSLYQIFERINTGGRILKSQEIRNCIYQGKFNTLLLELNKYTAWRTLFGLKDEEPRMLDIEFILRFFALSTAALREKDKGMISLKKYLNDYMDSKESKDDQVLTQRKEDFTKTIDFIYKSFGERAFHNISPKEPEKLVKKFHPTVFDSISVATFYALKKKPNLSIDGAEEKRIALLKDKKYENYTTIRTTNYESINGRISLALQYLYNMKHE
ncbi:MAG: DUF262 domain-containing protein [Bacteroidetes bacterium]|nr:DUF262 domain-containing protein [Bacteroidota bacterium]